MSAKVNVNAKAIAEILRSDAVLADLKERGERIAQQAGPGHRVEAEIGRKRARVAVITDTFAARRSEAKDRNLTRSLDAGR